MRAESSQLLKLSSVSERVSQGFAEIGSRVENIWDHELFTTEEKILGENGAFVTRTRGITVGKIVLGVIGLAAGYIIAKTLARLVRARLGRRFSVEIARAAFLEKVIFYFLLVLVVLASQLAPHSADRICVSRRGSCNRRRLRGPNPDEQLH